MYLKIQKQDNYSRSFKSNFGIGKDETVFLQATRIVPRKRIELSIELVRKLKNPKAVFKILSDGAKAASPVASKKLAVIKKQAGLI